MGSESDITFAAMRRLSSAYVRCGDFEKARRVIERMIKAASNTPGPDGEPAGVELALLEQAYRLHLHLGAPQRASSLCARAEEVAMAAGDWTGVVAAQSAQDLASIMSGHPASTSFVRAIETAEAHGGECSRVTRANVWRNRGALLFAMRHQLDASPLECFDRALDELRAAAEASGSSLDQPCPADSRQCRVIALTAAAVRVAKGFCAIQLEDYATSGTELTTALKAYEGLLPSEHPSLARALSMMGLHLHRTQKAVTAEGLFRSALEKFEAAPLLLPYQRRDRKAAMLFYAHLLSQWERREAEGQDTLSRAKRLGAFPPCAFAEELLPMFPFLAAGGESGPDALAELELCSAPSSLFAIGGLELELQHVQCSKCEARM